MQILVTRKEENKEWKSEDQSLYNENQIWPVGFLWIFVVIEQCSPSDMPDAKQRKHRGQH